MTDHSALGFPADGIRVEVLDPGMAETTISLMSASKLVRGVQAMVAAAAWAAVEPNNILEGSKPSLTNKYQRTVQLGQTERSPYSITVLSPLAPMFESADDDQPYSRLSVLTLGKALQALVDFASHPDWNEEALIALIGKGVSANLCAGVAAAISSLGKRKAKKSASLNGNLKAIRVAFEWSSTLAVPAGTPNSVVLEAEMLDTIKQIEAALKSFVRDDFKFEGYVTQFSIGNEDRSGKIIIERVSEERPSRFLLEVSEIEYDKALDALRDKSLVAGIGTLVRNGAQFHIADLKTFDIAQPETS